MHKQDAIYLDQFCPKTSNKNWRESLNKLTGKGLSKVYRVVWIAFFLKQTPGKWSICFSFYKYWGCRCYRGKFCGLQARWCLFNSRLNVSEGAGLGWWGRVFVSREPDPAWGPRLGDIRHRQDVILVKVDVVIRDPEHWVSPSQAQRRLPFLGWRGAGWC